jgi:hypothetical protein
VLKEWKGESVGRIIYIDIEITKNFGRTSVQECIEVSQEQKL